MDGQHAHALRFDLHVTLDLDFGSTSICAEKIVERRRIALLVGQRQGQEFVDWVGGFGSEPADERPPPTILAEEQGIEGKGRKRLAPLPAIFEPMFGLESGDRHSQPQARRLANLSVQPQFS